MPSFPRGAQDKEEARWIPLPLPTTPGQPQRGAQGSVWSAGSPASSPGECSQLGRGALVSSHLPTDRNGGRSKHSLYSTAMRQGTSTLTATLNTFKGHNSSPLKHWHLSNIASSHYLARYPEPVLPPSTNIEPRGCAKGGRYAWAPEAATAAACHATQGWGCRFAAGYFRRCSQQLERLQWHTLWERDSTCRGNTWDKLPGPQNISLEP